MRKFTSISISVIVAVVLGLMTWLWLGHSQTAQAAQLVEQAAQRLVIPQPGQVAHYHDELYTRQPPAGLEPKDPYHLPYADIWREWQTQDTWLEIGPDGQLTRWRTQLWSASGELLQDLVFDGQAELDYFPLEGLVSTVPSTKVEPYVDKRVSLFNRFLAAGTLTRRVNRSIYDKEVISVYTPLHLYALSSTEAKVAEALLSFQGLFVADLNVVSTGLRIDFDPTTQVAVGQAQVAYDAAGQEHTITYQTISDPEILLAGDARLNGLFGLTLPAGVTHPGDEVVIPKGNVLTDLDQIAKQVSFPIYQFPTGLLDLQLVETEFASGVTGATLPQRLATIDQAGVIGAGVRTLYIRPASASGVPPAATLTLIQGPREAMTRLLRATPPTWLKAEAVEFQLAEQQFPGWVMSKGYSIEQVKCVIETRDTLLYLDAAGLTIEDVRVMVKHLSRMKE